MEQGTGHRELAPGWGWRTVFWMPCWPLVVRKAYRKDRPRIRGDISGHLGRKSRVWKRMGSLNLDNE